jgi:hypothetical protein
MRTVTRISGVNIKLQQAGRGYYNIPPCPATRLTLIRNLLVSGTGSPPSELNNFRVVP